MEGHERSQPTCGRHIGLVVENSAEVIAIGKHLRLLWQERPPGVNHVDARQSVLPRHFLDTCTETILLFS